jgi:4-alpha-glucanotransferase
VPPDFFSETGQLWGNPIYDWEQHAETGYAWWIARLDALRRLVDLIRIDHFRAFADYWEVPASSLTARVGRWVDGPGRPFFDAVEAALGDLPIIAEDLGEMHDVVPELRDAVGLPGMAVLQFGLDGEPDNPFHPDVITEHTVVYTGTHDNDTTAGWYAKLDPDEQALVDGELGSTADTINFDMIETAWRTPAVLAVTPLQDVLGLGTEARMNTPSTTGGNWTWRITGDALIADRARYLADLNRATGRHRRASR